MRDHAASLVVVDGHTADVPASLLLPRVVHWRLGARTWGAWDAARPGAARAGDDPAPAWALLRADKSAGWNWELLAGRPVAADAGPRDVVQAVPDLSLLAHGWNQRLPLRLERWEIGLRRTRSSAAAAVYPGQEPATSAPAVAVQGTATVRAFVEAPEQEEQPGVRPQPVRPGA